MKKERVIFRRMYDPYMKLEKYLACFPDDEAKYGNIAYVPIYMNGDYYSHDSYAEMPYEYYYKYKIVHKREPIIEELIKILKFFYGGEYTVIEKVRY